MKQINNFWILGFVLILFLNIKCSGQNKDKLELKLDLNVSDELLIEQRATQNIKLTLSGKEQRTITNINSSLRIIVSQKSDQGYVLNLSFVDMSFQMINPQMNYEFSTKKQLNPDDKFGLILRKFIGLELQAKISKNGIVGECKGIENYVDTILNTFDLQAEQKEQIKYQMITYFGTKTIKSTLDPFINIYPKNAVKIGDTWTTGYENKNTIPYVFDNKFRLNDVNNQEILISGQSEISTTNEKAFGTNNYYSLSGNQDISIKLNPKTKFLKSGEFKSNSKGYVNYETESQTQKIPIEVSTELYYTIK